MRTNSLVSISVMYLHLAFLAIVFFVDLTSSAESSEALLSSGKASSSENSQASIRQKRAPGWGKRNSMNDALIEDSTRELLNRVAALKRAPGWGKRSGQVDIVDEGMVEAEVPPELGKRAPGWGKRAPGWGKRAPGWGKRAPGWGKRSELFDYEDAVLNQDKRAPGWGKRAPGWGKRSVEMEPKEEVMAGDQIDDWVKRAPGWGKRAPGWGKRSDVYELDDGTLSQDKRWGKRAPGWGKRAPGWGKRAPGWGKRSDSDLCKTLAEQYDAYFQKAEEVRMKSMAECGKPKGANEASRK